MLGHPPDIHVVMTICDFLLLIHPAASTYVNHTPSEFYFIQKWGELPLKGVFQTENFPFYLKLFSGERMTNVYIFHFFNFFHCMQAHENT